MQRKYCRRNLGIKSEHFSLALIFPRSECSVKAKLNNIFCTVFMHEKPYACVYNLNGFPYVTKKS